MKATFSSAKRVAQSTRLVCRETGDIYLISPALLGGLEIRCNGVKLAERSNMSWALAFVQKDAELAVRDMHRPAYQQIVVGR